MKILFHFRKSLLNNYMKVKIVLKYRDFLLKIIIKNLGHLRNCKGKECDFSNFFFKKYNKHQNIYMLENNLARNIFRK